MKFKTLVVVTLCMAIATMLVLAYEKFTATPAGKHERAWKMFRLRETEHSASYFELVDPLDSWTAQAIQDLTQCVSVDEKYWNQCQITSTNVTVFKYGEKFYTFTSMLTRRIVTIHVEPERETGNGVYISLRETMHSPINTVYELDDPLDPWTEAAIQDLDCSVVVDDIYHDQCALLTGKRLTDVFFHHSLVKHHGKYYTGDELAFYDSFRVKVPTREIIIMAWILLGLYWLGSGIHAVKKRRDARITGMKKGET